VEVGERLSRYTKGKDDLWTAVFDPQNPKDFSDQLNIDTKIDRQGWNSGISF
jgi:hypothetical protein